MTAFIVGTILLTSLIIAVINQSLENRTTNQVDEYIRAITLANDIIYQSFPSDKYVYQFVNQPPGSGVAGLSVNEDSIIRHILVVDEKGKIINSSDRKDLGQMLPAEIRNLPPLRKGDIKLDADASSEQDRTMSYSLETDLGKRNVIVVISMNRLQRVKESVERDRLLALALLSVPLIFIVAVVSRRLTRPIADLGQAARSVTAGDLDFSVPVHGPEEVRALSKTFNEMLAGLRNKRELEDQLQRAERSAMVGRLASGIAHEIRNPLNFINLSIDHLREKYAPPAEGARAEYTHILKTIKDELARLNRLVSDFLSYGRPAKLKFREVDARSLIEEVRALVSTQSEQQNVKINILQNGGGEARLSADVEQIKTCFSNIMINAVQAMPEGGSLNIALRPNSSEIAIEFADTGQGIAPEEIEQIFEPYYSTKETGIGLGLPLTRKIIEEHGGRIEVTSRPGGGTKFTVTLKRHPKLVS